MNPLVSRLEREYSALISDGNLLQSLFLLFVRLYWGWQFFQTGWGKLHNLPHVVEFFSSLGIPAPALNAYFVSGLECFGGILLAVGLGSRLLALLFTADMLVAYMTADHAALFSIFSKPEDFYAAAPYTFLVASVVILIFGPGRFSLDYLIGLEPLLTASTSLSGKKRAVAALLGVASLWTFFKVIEVMTSGGLSLARFLDITHPSLAGIVGLGSWVAYFFFRSRTEEDVAPALCYVLGFITGIIFLETEPEKQNPVVRFHAFQSIFLSVGCIAINVALSSLMLSTLTGLISLAFLALWLFMIFSAYRGKTVVLPVIGPLAQQRAQK